MAAVDNTGLPVNIPASRGREILRDQGFEPMEGSKNPRGEHWVHRSGFPVFVPYAGPPFIGTEFEAEAFGEALAMK